jgi:hypothetical protein
MQEWNGSGCFATSIYDDSQQLTELDKNADVKDSKRPYAHIQCVHTNCTKIGEGQI